MQWCSNNGEGISYIYQAHIHVLKANIQNHQVRHVFRTWDLNQQEFVQRKDDDDDDNNNPDNNKPKATTHLQSSKNVSIK